MSLKYTVDNETRTVTVLIETDMDVTLHGDPEDHHLEPTNPRELQHFVGLEFTREDLAELTALLAEVQS